MSNESNAPVIPPGIASLFKKPPLLVTESRQDYDAVFNSVAQTITPMNSLEWIGTGNYVDQQWEIKRLRQAKAGMINATRREAFRTVFESILPETDDRIEIAANIADQCRDRRCSNRDRVWKLLRALIKLSFKSQE
jgi:hypothetical protein